MNGRKARKLRKRVGGQELVNEREYFYTENNKRTYRLSSASARKRYQFLKRSEA